MPPKPSLVNYNLTDSSTYDDILPLWREQNFRLTKFYVDMSNRDNRPLKYKALITHLYARMEPAFRIATRAVISSSSFHLKVLCADHIQLDDKRKVLDPSYEPTDEDRIEYRNMMAHLSTKHHLYAHDHGRFYGNIYGESLFSSSKEEYVWWTILNAWFIEEHYARLDYDQIPEPQRRNVDLILAVTLAHEFAHTVNNYRDWKILFKDLPYQHREPDYVLYTNARTEWSEPCFAIQQFLPELGDAWENFALDGTPSFMNQASQTLHFEPDIAQGLVWDKRNEVTCNTIVRRAGSLAIAHALDVEQTRLRPTRLPSTTVDRLISKACWDYVENLLDTRGIMDSAQFLLVRELQLFQVLKQPSLYSWLLYVPRFGSTPASAGTALLDVLMGLVYDDTRTEDRLTDLDSQALAAARPTQLPSAPVMMQNGATSVRDTNQQGPSNTPMLASEAFFTPGTSNDLPIRTSRPNRLVKEVLEAASSKRRKASAGKTSKGKSKSSSSSSRSVGPRAKAKSAAKQKCALREV